MMKKSLLLLGFVSTILLAGCGKNTDINSTQENAGGLASGTSIINDTLAFKAEYEALNDNEHPHMNVPENLNIHILSFDQTQAMLNSGSGILFFWFPSCPWCRNLLPELFAAMEKSNVKDLYYFNPKELRDQKELVDGKIVVKKETSPEYQWILDKLDTILPAYEGLNNPTIKRLYVPAVLVIKEGKILNHHFDTLPEQKDPQIPLTNDQKIKLQTILQEAISPLSNTTCGIPKVWEKPKYSC